jgi:SNF2 family DNA or RNA helicase
MQILQNNLPSNGTLRLEGKFIFDNKTVPDAALKKIGARYDKKLKTWTLPPIYSTLSNLRREIGSFVIDPSCKAIELSDYGFSAKHSVVDESNPYYPYQLEAIDYLSSTPHHGALLSLSPGLGKTATTIGAMLEKQARSALIVAPLSLLGNWQEECQIWAKNTPVNVSYRDVPKSDVWNIANYHTIADFYIDYLRSYDILVIDESIVIKNRNTKLYKKLLEISKMSGKVWLLSGAPIANHGDDLWSQLHIIEPSYFTSYWRFAETYCYIEETVWGDRIVGTKDINFRNEFKDLIFVRTHEEVLPNLPKPIFESIRVDMLPAQKKAYDELRDNFVTYLSNETKVSVKNRVSQMIRLQQVASNLANIDPNISESAKQVALKDLLDNEAIQLPAIIWVNWRTSALKLYEELSHFTKYRVALAVGGSSKNTDTINAYKRGEYDILILSLGVGKFGHTLTNTQTMIYFDRMFNNDTMNQSLARVHGRIGLDHQPLIITFKARGTIDDLLDTNLAGKMRSLAKLTAQDLSKLIQGMYTDE